MRDGQLLYGIPCKRPPSVRQRQMIERIPYNIITMGKSYTTVKLTERQAEVGYLPSSRQPLAARFCAEPKKQKQKSDRKDFFFLLFQRIFIT